MELCSEIIQLIVHTRRSVDQLANKYHNGGNWGAFLTGYCGIASRFLISLARRNGIHNMRLVCGAFNKATHCWVEYENFCIDITISQFEGFHSKAYRICMTDSDFYRSHYMPKIFGSSAVKHQKHWEQGQNYESCASILWRIHRKNYIRDYNGQIFQI